jgi:hypothetical protein
MIGISGDYAITIVSIPLEIVLTYARILHMRLSTLESMP